MQRKEETISKPRLTLKVAIKNIRMYVATIKDNKRYKDTSEIRTEVYHEVAAVKKKKKKTMHMM